MFSLGALTAAQLALSLVVQAVIIALLGAGEQTDSWVAAQAIPLVLYGIATIAFQGAWQAEFAVAADDDGAFREKQNCAHGQLLLGLGALVVAFAVTARLWTGWLFPGFSDVQVSLTGELTVFLLFSTLLNAHNLLFIAAMRARRSFVLPEAIATIGSVLAVVLTALSVRHAGVIAAAWASLARSIFVSIALFVLSGRALPSVRQALRDVGAWKRMNPLLMSSTVAKSGPLVDRFLGSLAPPGGLTTFNLALMGMTALSSVLERSLATVATTSIGRIVRQNDFDGVRQTYRRCLKRATWAALAVLAALIVLHPFWPQLTSATIGLSGASAIDIWWYCVLLTAFLVPASAGSAITFSFYAFGDTKTPARVATISFLLSIGLKAVGFHLLGIIGIVMGILLHYLGNLAVLCWLLERRLRREQDTLNPPASTP